jgi:hypothetical protein
LASEICGIIAVDNENGIKDIIVNKGITNASIVV